MPCAPSTEPAGVVSNPRSGEVRPPACTGLQLRTGWTWRYPWQLDVGAPETAFTVRFDPYEYRGQDEHRPGLQRDHLTGQWDVDVGQALNESAQVVSWPVRPAVSGEQLRVELIVEIQTPTPSGGGLVAHGCCL